jgi:peptidoglycan/LPS O-acetylase OafA/YrhL
MDTTALRALAIVLIANSHLEAFYPFRLLAGDGLLGNSLFFMLSGLGLSLSPRAGTGRFIEWHRRRLSRIYPSLWLTVLVGIVLIQGAWRQWTLLDFAGNLLWPTPYHFLCQIIVYYPAFYVLKALKNPSLERGVFLGLTLPYLAVAWFHYDLHVLSWIYCFQVMVFGGLVAGRVNQMGRDGKRDLLVLTATLATYILIKLGMVTGRVPNHVAILHFLTFPIIWSLLRLSAGAPMRAVARHPWLSPALGLLAGMTLEIYLVHGFAFTDQRVLMLPFPINIAVFWAATLVMACALSAAADRARRVLGLETRAREALPLRRTTAVAPLS